MCNVTNEETRSKILRFIDNYTRRHQCCPSIREIASAIGIKSLSTMHGYIERMRKEGLLVSQAHVARTIQINRKNPQCLVAIKTNTKIRRKNIGQDK